MNNPQISVSDIKYTLQTLNASIALTTRVVTVRVIAENEYIKRESSGQAKVKRARCFDLKWSGAPQLQKQPPKKKQKKSLLPPPTTVMKTEVESEEEEIEEASYLTSQNTPLTEASIKTLSNYAVHPWEALNLNVERGGRVEVGSGAVGGEGRDAVGRGEVVEVARRCAGVKGGRGKWMGGEMDSRSFVSIVKSFKVVYPEVPEESFLRYLPEEVVEMPEGHTNNDEETETPVKEEEEESPASITSKTSNMSEEPPVESVRENLLGFMDKAEPSPAASAAAEVASNQLGVNPNMSNTGMSNMFPTLPPPPPPPVAQPNLTPRQTDFFQNCLQPPPRPPSPPKPTPMQQYNIQVEHLKKLQQAKQKELSTASTSSLPQKEKTTYNPKSKITAPPKKRKKGTQPYNASSSTSSTPTQIYPPSPQRDPLAGIYRSIISAQSENARKHRRREFQFMTSDKVGGRLREMVNRGEELREEERRVWEILGE
ncbi:hypothetical protein TL16_g05553 [Triparma laevis f. inornata]|uniref:Uncharacterized protein n=1 Tax=Triparma laevis f. inornata TaxID=1714386 RepID=A0A9W7ANJ2_9STRA|nr:hypothetical protein TL16_g05553 [Triparma laevis f. inornata]